MATTVLLLAGFVAPVVEFFDYWDPEGLGSDTEVGVFALIFVLCLVLLVCKLISSGAFAFFFAAWIRAMDQDRAEDSETRHRSIFAIPPLYSLPLRI
jgi:hypothetical protein